MDKTGKTEPIIATPGPYLNPRIAPDGKRIAVAVGHGKADIWIYGLGHEAPTKLTFADTNHGPVWSPDGKHIVYSSQSKGTAAIMWTRSDGAGEPQRLWESKTFVVPTSFSPEGRSRRPVP